MEAPGITLHVLGKGEQKPQEELQKQKPRYLFKQQQQQIEEKRANLEMKKQAGKEYLARLKIEKRIRELQKKIEDLSSST